jgi:hypothetical protein
MSFLGYQSNFNAENRVFLANLTIPPVPIPAISYATV